MSEPEPENLETNENPENNEEQAVVAVNDSAKAPVSEYSPQEAERGKLERELREKTLKLKASVEDFAETVDEKKDKWFQNPAGWLLGPGEKRAADVESASSKRTSLSKIVSKVVGGTNYAKRWFVLDAASKTLKYYKDEKTRIETGCIDMTTVVDFQACTDPDGPQFSFDLVGRGGRCSLGGLTNQDIIRWCYAIEEVIKSVKPLTKGEGVTEEEQRWFRYSYTYQEAGPLMVNVVGLTDQDNQGNIQSHWLLVTSFARFPDGKSGASEKSGVIKIKDYIVGVNNIDLTVLPYHEAMAAIRAATFPKTVYFLRDLQNKQETIFVEGWCYSFYAGINRRRKRYVEMDSEFIHFRKPSSGGSASVKRDSSFALDQISYVRSQTDLNLPEDSQHILRIVCNAGSVIQLLGNDDLVVGTSPVDTLDLCFSVKSELDNWTKFLSNASLRPRKLGGQTVGDILVTPHDIIKKNDSVESLSYIDVLGIRSYVSGTFAPREFSITEDGFLYWNRIKSTKKDANVFRTEKGRRLFLANTSMCPLRGIYAVVDTSAEPIYRYQLLIQDLNQIVWIGMHDEETVMKWVKLIGAVIEKAPEAARSHITIPDVVLPLEVVMQMISAEAAYEEEPLDANEEPAERSRAGSIFSFVTGGSTNQSTGAEPSQQRKSIFNFGRQNSTDVSETASNADESTNNRGRTNSLFGGGRASMARMSMQFMNLNSTPKEDDDPTPETVNGYLFYKHNSRVKRSFSKFWFSLKGYKLYYYKDKVKPLAPGASSAAVSANKPLGFIDLLEVLQVHESVEAGSPENSIDLVTPSRSYKLIANDEDQCLKWLDALGETLELRKETIKQEDKIRNQTTYLSTAERINALKKTIMYQGGLSMKTLNKLTSFVSWKSKYFVISKGGLLEFENQDSVFLTENYKEIISLHSIRLVESSSDNNCNYGCAFDIHAYVPQGGNKDGLRVFTFEAQTVNLCKEWMTQLCDATGTLVLQPRANGEGFASVVNDKLKKKKEQQIKNTGKKFVVLEKDQDAVDEANSRRPFSKAPEAEEVHEVKKTEFFSTAANTRRGPSMGRAAGGRGPGLNGRGPGLSHKAVGSNNGGTAPQEMAEPASSRSEAPVEEDEEEGEEEAAIPVNDDAIPEPLPSQEFV